MPLSEDDARNVAKELLGVRHDELARLDAIKRYMDGDVCKIYSPRKTTAEYKQIVAMSKINILPLVVSAFAENLFAEGYRGKKAKDNAAAWELWQDNRMDLRQSLIYRSALTYGLAYATALPKKGGGALITPYSSRELTAVYDDPVNDEWPVYAIACSHGYDAATRKRVVRVKLFDSEWVYRFVKASGEDDLAFDEEDSGAHGLPETPVVRWVNAGQDLDCGPVSEVEPLFELQDQLDNTTYALLIKQQFQAFKQRYVTGMTIEEDANGNPREPFRIGVDRLLHAESPDTKFGEFAEGDLGGLLESRQSTLNILAARAQISPHSLLVATGTVANLSADALAALEATQQRKMAEMKTSFGEADEQLLRLCCAAADIDGFDDRSSQIIWRDTESRSLGQAADAANKLAALGLPPKALWDLLAEWIGLPQQDRERWDQYAKEEDGADAGIAAPPSPEQMMMAGGQPNAVPAGPAVPAGQARTPGNRVPVGA